MKNTIVSDKKLLEKFSPIIRYTKGEIYFPVTIDNYIKHCKLIAHLPDGTVKTLVEKNQLKVNDLSKDYELPAGSVLYLKLTEDKNIFDSIKVFQKKNDWSKDKKNSFSKSQGRLVRVGVLSRFFDALFSVTFILRGTVPGLASAQSAVYFIEDAKKIKNATIYGRVVRDKTNGWIALQYWYFYYFNDWRSTFSGVNDHESDWEMTTIYLYEDKGDLIPEWAAYASHDFHGDDLRRRFDHKDEITIIDNHPVIFAGAGSHASYFKKGEYLTSIPVPYPKILKKPIEAFEKFWRNYFDLYGSLKFTIPFIDYARGDGLSFGYKQKNKLNIEVISDSTPWVKNYDGLWGYFAQDPVSGEDAPAGPRYNRNKRARASWIDPFVFAGLDKVPTPNKKANDLLSQLSEIKKQTEIVIKEIKSTKNYKTNLNTQYESLKNNNASKNIIDKIYKSLQDQDAYLNTLNEKRTDLEMIENGLTKELERTRKGIKDDPYTHINNMAVPQEIKLVKHNRLTETWAALSISLLLISVVLTIFFIPNHILLSLIVSLYFLITVESVLRGNFSNSIVNISLSLALIASIIIIMNNFIGIFLIILILSAGFVLIDNLREVLKH